VKGKIRIKFTARQKARHKKARRFIVKGPKREVESDAPKYHG
jgi:hypothetical protein